MTEITGTGAGGSAQAVQSPRKLAGLLGALVPISWRCLTRFALNWMDATHCVLRGPFSSADDVELACTKWSRDGALQIAGTFKWVRANSRIPNRVRGYERTFLCNGCHACKLVYEEAADNSYISRLQSQTINLGA